MVRLSGSTTRTGTGRDRPGAASAEPGRDEMRARAMVDDVYRTDSRRVFATLIRLVGGDFDLAEEALQEAFTAAVEQWPRQGVPANPRAWLVSAGRFKAIDTLRRRKRFDAAVAEYAHQLHTDTRTSARPRAALPVSEEPGIGAVEDDRLRLIFTCCHPALPPEARVALTLREVCGLTTEEIARAFLTAPATLAQRIVRAKAKIRDARIPYCAPSPEDLPERLDAVLAVVYLVFSEGYATAAAALSAEAIRLGRLLLDLLPAELEVAGLLALMLLHDSRRAARTSPTTGDLILLEDQDRTLWDRARIAEGTALTERALRAGPSSRARGVGPYALQAAIAAVHAEAPTVAATDWPQVVALYDLLLSLSPSPVVALNRAVAVAMRDGPAAGLALIDALLVEGDTLTEYHLAHAARADLCRRLGRTAEARAAYERALTLTRHEPERRFLAGRLAEMVDMGDGASGPRWTGRKQEG